jgi:ribosome biogenesis GTPase
LTKRRLSKQQLGRIAKNQGRELGNAAQDAATLDARVNGVVISHYGKQLDIEPLDGSDIVRCHQRANLPALVTGDRVVWEAGDDGVGVVLALGERRSVFARPVFGGVVKPMAANIDVVLVVLAPTPMPMANLIDRYLVAIETLGLQPMLILNKSDLKSQCEDPDRLAAMLEIYRSLDYPVLEVSATTWRRPAGACRGAAGHYNRSRWAVGGR